MTTSLKPYCGDWTSVDGMSSAEVQVLPADLPWPAMVSVEFDIRSTLTSQDVEGLAVILGAAAGNADWLSRKARAEVESA